MRGGGGGGGVGVGEGKCHGPSLGVTTYSRVLNTIPFWRISVWCLLTMLVFKCDAHKIPGTKLFLRTRCSVWKRDVQYDDDDDDDDDDERFTTGCRIE